MVFNRETPTKTNSKTIISCIKKGYIWYSSISYLISPNKYGKAASKYISFNYSTPLFNIRET
ncbi:MAG: hypothetical protein KGD67_11835, partial [Candidatus Lokiarchaeota archaeon]|nr:hypothetical protein [Candidatus Lokiarchaeota archaeon]